MGKGAEWHNTQFCGLRNTRATRQGRWKPITNGRKNNTPATPTLTQAGANTTSISSSRRDAITTSFRAGLSKQELVKQIAELTVETISPEQVNQISGYLDTWDDVSFDDKRRVVDLMITTVAATSDSLNITWKI